ncbi:BTB/POZ domain-containing protein [Vitis vinifera]|uniref:BTB/POZ domain-containing protein n=1 Tax=Vitis vinifera TaxID=29760 RepID=A0A438DDG3_VITVI|nr:BTB/POZ domain-containing protein [Vitis vinifera]
MVLLFLSAPDEPEHLRVSQPKPLQKFETLSKSGNSFPNSPQSARSGLGLVGRIDPRRILSPGRVSPIDSDPSGDLVHDILVDPSPVRDTGVRSASFRAPLENFRAPPEGSASPGSCNVVKEGENGAGFLISVFADLISDYRKGCSGPAAKLCRIEVPEVEHLGVFRETIELMFEEDITKRLLKAGVYRSIDILEVMLLVPFLFSSFGSWFAAFAF